MVRLWIVGLLIFLGSAGPVCAENLRVLALSSEHFFFESDGQHQGIEYAVLALFARRNGYELDIEYAESFADLLERIANGEADVAAGTITITEERDERMDFSASYLPVQVVLVERKDEISDSPSDLKGASVAAFEKTTAETALAAIGGVDIVQRGGTEAMLDAVARGEIDGAAGDSSALLPVIDDYPTLEITLSFGEPQNLGFALREGSKLRDPLNAHIAGIKQAGIYYRLLTEHMGPRATEIVRAARKDSP